MVNHRPGLSLEPAERRVVAPFRVLVSDPLSPEGLELLRGEADVDVAIGLTPVELKARLREYDALVVRSETKVTRDIIEAGPRLKVIGRAGVGVDNIDVDAATRHGIVVVNAPSGNTIAAAEHTIALILALARKIPQAHMALRRGEWTRSRFMGVEVRGKTLGIVGLGRIGTEVARRAQGLEMKVIAYDPYVSAELAAKLGVEMLDLDHLLERSDFVTIHVPGSPQSRGLIGPEQLARMRRDAYVINCARGGIVDEEALLHAVEEKRLAGAALDVFSTEPLPATSPLLKSDRIIVTPHLAGSTREAQVNVAVQVAGEVLAVLKGFPAQYAVNAPAVSSEMAPTLLPFIELAWSLGCIATQLADGQFKSVEVVCSGEIADYDTAALSASALQGILGQVSEERINLVNARLVARQRGLRVVESKSPTAENYSSLVGITITTDLGETSVFGTVMNGEPHVVRIGRYWLDFVPAGGYMLVTQHQDRPGIVGKVGTILGEADINISFMQVGRQAPRGEALMVLSVDEPIPPEVAERIKSILHVSAVKVISLGWRPD